jgi:hypothetical protein
LNRDIAVDAGLFDALNPDNPASRNPLVIIHDQRPLLVQRITAIALGYEHLNVLHELRNDPVHQVATGKVPELDLSLA